MSEDVPELALLDPHVARAEQLGVKVQFQERVESLEQFGDADVIIGADGTMITRLTA